MNNLSGNILQDLRFAGRQLRRSPGFTAVAVLTLALGIGATSAVFTLFYQVILRSLPVAHPEQLYKVGKPIRCCNYGGTQDDWSIFSYDLYRSFRDHTPGVQSMAAVQAGVTTLSVRRAGNTAAPQPLDVRHVSGNYFTTIGVEPFTGRLLRADDDQTGAAPVAVLSYPVWQAKFHGDPAIVGSALLLSGHPVTVIGITQPAFLGERNDTDPAGIWVPLSHEPVIEPERKLLQFPTQHWLDVVARVPDRSSLPRAQAALQGELVQWLRANRTPDDRTTDAEISRQTTELVAANGGINTLRDSYERSLKLLQSAAAFVLLIACANLANLLLVRGMARAQELNVRTAMGAPRSRLIRQMLVESLALASLGGLASIFVAYAGSKAILSLALPNTQVNPLHAAPSLPVLAFSFALAVVTGLIFGTAPAYIASRANPADALRGANRTTRDASALPQKTLVILQTALSLALLSTAGLLVLSLRALQHQDLRFQPKGRLIAFIDLQAAGYKPAQLPNLYRSMDQAFAGVPGITQFAYATYGPMSNNNWGSGIALAGADPNARTYANYSAVSSHFFETVGTRLLLGRGFTEADTATSTHVAVVNQTFVSKYFSGKQPIGMHFGPDSRLSTEWEIVGVVDDSKYGDPAENSDPMYFLPMTQKVDYSNLPISQARKDSAELGQGFMHFASNLMFSYQGDKTTVANQIREKLKAINPDIPVIKLMTYDEQIGTYFTQQELVVRLTSIFGALALLLAAIGLYGVTAYSVQRRTSEIGIRMAVGASRGGVLLSILRTALLQASIGLLLGLPLAYAAARVLRSQLYQTGTFQPLILLGSALLLLLAAVMAALVPARRAASIDPMQALRTQ